VQSDAHTALVTCIEANQHLVRGHRDRISANNAAFDFDEVQVTSPRIAALAGGDWEEMIAACAKVLQRLPASMGATAMFMIALFAQPSLARTLMEPGPVLPSGGPTFRGLQLLHQAAILPRPPAGTELDDASFEPGVLYENNGLFSELRRGRSDWSLVDVHSGLYMLGTRRKMGLD
jgi:hypothetical protein